MPTRPLTTTGQSWLSINIAEKVRIIEILEFLDSSGIRCYFKVMVPWVRCPLTRVKYPKLPLAHILNASPTPVRHHWNDIYHLQQLFTSVRYIFHVRRGTPEVNKLTPNCAAIGHLWNKIVGAGIIEALWPSVISLTTLDLTGDLVHYSCHL